MNDQSWLKSIKLDIGNYISGFVDGEGSFNVSIKKRIDYKNTWKITPSFNVSQDDITVLALIKKELGCGTLRTRRDGIIYFEVTNIKSLKEKVIPFFEKFNFLSSKKKTNFSIFKKIVEKIYLGEHLNKKGFDEIIKLREDLNKNRGRKRKYNLQDIIG
jgi:hypothetical protein